MAEKIEIKPCEDEDVANFADDMKSWLEAKAKAKDLQSTKIYLLSFHDDGVVWGKVKDSKLLTSDKNLPNTPSPEFRSETLQELRLFGEKGQLHIWRIGENKFNASLASENYLEQFESIEESQVLHGTKIDKDIDGNELKNKDFTIVADGSEGLRHAFPQPIQTNKFDSKKRPLRLHVKHYIEYDNDGCARIAFSRLVDVSVE